MGSRGRPFFLSAATACALAGCGNSGAPTTPSARSPGQVGHHAAATGPATHPAGRQTGTVITVRKSQYGPILFDGADRAIYLFTRDASRASTCSGSCARAWPPVLTKGAPQPSGGLPGALGRTRRRDGSLQVSYGGHPLYYYVGDVKQGEIRCQNVEEFGGTWLVVSRRGTPVR
jgi:predicted lipoprotein with Yx(FWY)xxD motif